MPVTCASCGTVFEAKRRTAVYCSTHCRRKAGKQRAKRRVVRIVTSEPLPVAGVRSAIHAKYDGGPLLDSPLGQLALRLAGDIDDPPPMTSIAAVARELRAALAALDALKPPSANPLALIRERHAGRAGSA